MDRHPFWDAFTGANLFGFLLMMIVFATLAFAWIGTSQ